MKTVSGEIQFPNDGRNICKVYRFSGMAEEGELEAIHAALEDFHKMQLGLKISAEETKIVKEISLD